MPAATMGGRNGRTYSYLKILLLLFLLNCLSLYFYFRPPSTPSPDPTNRREDASDLLRLPLTGSSGESSSASAASRSMKHWPILPAYLPWTNPGHSPAYRSCEAFFGNGFIKDLPVMSVSSAAGHGEGGGGWFRCFFSETLRSSVCEGGSVRMNVGKIKMAKGGERLEEVMGRTEEEEMPVFEDGAFEVEEGDGRKEGDRLVDREFVNDYVGRNKMGELIGSARIVGKGQLQCDQVGYKLVWWLLSIVDHVLAE